MAHLACPTSCARRSLRSRDAFRSCAWLGLVATLAGVSACDSVLGIDGLTSPTIESAGEGGSGARPSLREGAGEAGGPGAGGVGASPGPGHGGGHGGAGSAGRGGAGSAGQGGGVAGQGGGGGGQ